MSKLIEVIKSDSFYRDPDDFKFKYLGLFKGSTLKGLNDISKRELLEAGIVEEQESFSGNDKYYLYSKPFGGELYFFLKLHVERALSDYGIGELDNCLYRIKKYINSKDKIEFLKKKYEEIYPQDIFQYAIYKGDTSTADVFTNGVRDWYDWVVNYQLDLNPRLVFLFLTFPYKKENGLFVHDQFGWFMNHAIQNKNELDEDFFDFLNEWSVFHEKDEALKSIAIKIEELEKENKRDKAYVRGKTLKDFLEESIFNSLKARLEADVLIDEKFKLKHPGDNKWSVLRAAACIGWLLMENKHIKLKQKELVTVLSQTFSVELSASTYTAAKKVFMTNNDNDEPHLENYSFINTL